jgi:hypothetical protein
MELNMRIKLLFLALFLFCINIAAQEIIADFSNPKDVAEKFLRLYFKGQWFEACKLLACEGCDDQISYMIKKIDEMDKVFDESKCTFTIEKFELDKDNTAGKIYYTKGCPDQKPVKNHITMKKVGEKWLVEYLYRRDKFL